MTNTHVRRILLDGRRAVGVEVERDGQVQRIGARRELIVSSGAINSPVLLLASGIGPAAELKAQGIEVQHDLPGVGKNLQDHYQASFVFKTIATDTLNEAVLSKVKSVKLALEWLFLRLRPARGRRHRGDACSASRTRRSSAGPAVSVSRTSRPNNLKDGLHKWPGFTFICNVCRPKSRGEITLRDTEGRTPPRIQANYLTDPDDMRVMLAGYRIAPADRRDRAVPLADHRAGAARSRTEVR